MSTTAHFTLLQYDRMVKAGVFETPTRQRIEFIRGEIREMSPIGPLHESVVDFLTAWSCDHGPRDKFKVRVQNSIGLPTAGSAPEPDIAWVVQRRYSQDRPSADDVVLLIEVAETSLEYDCSEKAELYARAGIADYWVVNIPERCIEVHRGPSPNGYQVVKSFRGHDEVRPLAAPEAILRPDDIWAAL